MSYAILWPIYAYTCTHVHTHTCTHTKKGKMHKEVSGNMCDAYK